MVGFQALGGLAVTEQDREVSVGGARQRRLLAMLLIHRNTVVPSDRLTDAIFDGEPTPGAATTLRSYVARIRRVVDSNGAPPMVLTQAPGYMLRVPDDAFDVSRFEAALAQARAALVADPAGAAALARQALGLWRGEPYGEFAHEDWARPEAQRLTEQRLAAHELLYAAELETGLATEIVAELEALAVEHPLRETFQAQLMLALYRSGRQADALRAYQRHRQAIVDEVGLDPTPELQALEQRILNHDPTLRDLEPTARRLRGYQLGVRLAADRDGTVYAARLPGIARELAVRVFRPEVADDPAFVRAFDADAQRVAALHHPAIVAIHDHWREPGAAYVVTPRFPGGALADRFSRGPLTDAELTAVVRRIGGALAAAAEVGIVHGQVNPDQVVFDEHGEPRLTDFNLGSRPEATTAHDATAFAELIGVCAPASHRITGVLPAPGTPAPPIAALVDALLAALDTSDAAGTAAPVNPYKGLLAFDETDAADYFGRSAVVDEVLARLAGEGRRGRLVLLVGGSGTGKSSLVRAGVIPRIRTGGAHGSAEWLVTTMLPGSAPIKELVESLRRVAVGDRAPADALLTATALGAAADGLDRALRALLPDGQLLLVVDQFEELFTLASERQQRAFLDALMYAIEAPDSRLRLLATLRADYYDRPLASQGFGPAVAAATVTIAAMTPADIEAVIVEPAERVGRRVERPLVAELVAATANQAAALPALQFTLWELAEGCGETLTSDAYRAMGGVDGAISSRAEQLYQALDDDDRSAVRQVFEQLVIVPVEGEPTRRAATRPELTGTPPDARTEAILDRWTQARLLTADRHPQSRVPTLEVAHEALLRQWPRLSGWIDQDRARLLAIGRLRGDAAGWADLGRDPGALYRGARLEATLDAVTHATLAPVEREFLDASSEARDAESREVADRLVRQARANRRLRIQLAAIAVALVAAMVGGFVALDQRANAESQRRVATARELASASTSAVTDDPDRSILLALEALDATTTHGQPPIPEAAEALHHAVSASRLVLSVPDLGGRVDWSPSGDLFVTEGPEDSGIVDLRDAATGESVLAFKGHDIDINDVRFSADGEMLATGGDDGALRVWDPDTGKELSAFQYSDGEVWSPSFSPDGRMVAAGWLRQQFTVRVFDLGTGEIVHAFELPAIAFAAFSADGSRLAVGDNPANRVTEFDLTSGEVARTIATDQVWVKELAFSPDGRWLATAGADTTVRLWDYQTGEPGPVITTHTGEVNGIDWNSDGTELVTASSDGTVAVIEINDQRWVVRQSVAAQSLDNGVWSVAFSPDGRRIVTGDIGVAAAKIWDVSAAGGGELFNVAASPWPFNPPTFLPGGDLLGIAPGGVLTRYDGNTGEHVGSLFTSPTGSEPRWAVMSPDRRRLAGAGDQLPLAIVDVSNGEAVGWIHGDEWIHDVTWNGDGTRLAVAVARGDHAEVLIVDQDGNLESTIREEPGVFLHAIRFDATGDQLYAARGTDRNDPNVGGLSEWDWRTGERVRSFGDTIDGEIAVDPTGRLLATAGLYDSVVEVWDTITGERVSELRRSGRPWDVTFNGDGTQLATADQSGTVRLWDPITGTQQLVLHHDDAVMFVVFAPDDTRLVTVTGDGVIRMWTLDIDELRAIAETRVTRRLTDLECRQYLHVEACPVD